MKYILRVLIVLGLVFQGYYGHAMDRSIYTQDKAELQKEEQTKKEALLKAENASRQKEIEKLEASVQKIEQLDGSLREVSRVADLYQGYISINDGLFKALGSCPATFKSFYDAFENYNSSLSTPTVYTGTREKLKEAVNACRAELKEQEELKQQEIVQLKQGKVIEQLTQKEWEISNKSEKMATLFTLLSPGNYQQVIIKPGMDFWPITIKPGKKTEMYLYTPAGSYQLTVDNKNTVSLAKEADLGLGKYGFKVFNTIPFQETNGLLFTIKSDGSVDFAKPNK